MSGDLLAFTGGASLRNPSGGSLAVRRETRAIDRRSAVQEVHEQARLQLAQLRLRNGLALAGQAVAGATQLDALITVLSADKPFFELEMRRFQQLVHAGAGALVANYLMGS